MGELSSGASLYEDPGPLRRPERWKVSSKAAGGSLWRQTGQLFFLDSLPCDMMNCLNNPL